MKTSRHRTSPSFSPIQSSNKLRRSSIMNSARRARHIGFGSMAPTSTPGTSSGTITSKNKRRSQFYNKTCAEKPTELFRTDLISDMKVPDLEPLNVQHSLSKLIDPWRRDWNNGVQVPIYGHNKGEKAQEEGVADGLLFPKGEPKPTSPINLPIPVFNEIMEDETDETVSIRHLRRKVKEDDLSSKFDLPASIGTYPVTYELDDLDLRWLTLVNANLTGCTYPRFVLTEDQLEKVMERLEIAFALRCADEQQSTAILRQKSDADAVCDVCRGEFSEEGNLLVFCDRCNVCVHQACYGIRRVPSGPWVCRPCSQDVRPSCILCPNRGGAFKPTKSGNKWAHISCAVWIPEVEFGNPILKEPIIQINKIPEERWTLLCVICEERNGACVQCSVRNCHVSYHVTCAQRAGWKVTYKDSLPKDGTDDVLDNFCKKHSKNWPRESSDDEFDDDVEIFSERQPKVHIASIAYQVLTGLSYCDLEHVFDHMREIPVAFRRAIFYYWRTKRLSSPDRILIFDMDECQIAVERDRKAEFIGRQMDSLINLRQTLEKTRTLCYMIERREKLKRQWVDTAAEEFRLFSSVGDHLSNNRRTDSGLKTKQFLEKFPLGYQLSAWLPQQQKISELYSLIPAVTMTKSMEPLKKALHKRGRPSQKILRVNGSHSPLTVVNNVPLKKSTQSIGFGRRINNGNHRILSTSSSEYQVDDDDDKIAQNVKRKRMPRVQYSPT